MAALVIPLIQCVVHCVVQGCCWYTVFQCCGCIEPPGHVEIDKQVVLPPVKIIVKPSDNPFINTEMSKSAY